MIAAGITTTTIAQSSESGGYQGTGSTGGAPLQVRTTETTSGLVQKPVPESQRMSLEKFLELARGKSGGSTTPAPSRGSGLVSTTPPPDHERNGPGLELGRRSELPVRTQRGPEGVQLPGITSAIPEEKGPEGKPVQGQVTVVKGKDGWNTVTVRSAAMPPVLEAPANGDGVTQAVEKKPETGGAPVLVSEPRSKEGAAVRERSYQVRDEQLHLFETSSQTQAKLADAQQAMSKGDASKMQQVVREGADRNAFWAKNSPIAVNPRRTGPGRSFGIRTSSGDLDPKLTEDPKEKAAASKLASLTGLERAAELVERGEPGAAREYLGDYLTQSPEDGRALLIYGLQEVVARHYDTGLKSLARVCELGAAPWSEKIDLPKYGVTETELANAVARMNAMHLAQKGPKEALGVAVVNQMAGRSGAAGKLLEQAVLLGYEKSDATLLQGYWKAKK